MTENNSNWQGIAAQKLEQLDFLRQLTGKEAEVSFLSKNLNKQVLKACQLEEANAGLVEGIEEREMLTAKLRSNLDAVFKHRDNLQTLADENETARMRLFAKNSQLELHLAEANNALAKSQQQLAEAEGEVKDLQEILEVMNTRLDRQKSELATAETKIEVLATEKSLFEVTRDDLCYRLKKAGEISEGYRASLNLSNQVIAMAKGMITEIKKEALPPNLDDFVTRLHNFLEGDGALQAEKAMAENTKKIAQSEEEVVRLREVITMAHRISCRIRPGEMPGKFRKAFLELKKLLVSNVLTNLGPGKSLETNSEPEAKRLREIIDKVKFLTSSIAQYLPTDFVKKMDAALKEAGQTTYHDVELDHLADDPTWSLDPGIKEVDENPPSPAGECLAFTKKILAQISGE